MGLFLFFISVLSANLLLMAFYIFSSFFLNSVVTNILYNPLTFHLVYFHISSFVDIRQKNFVSSCPLYPGIFSYIIKRCNISNSLSLFNSSILSEFLPTCMPDRSVMIFLFWVHMKLHTHIKYIYIIHIYFTVVDLMNSGDIYFFIIANILLP